MPSIHTDYWDPLFARVLRHRDRAVLPRRLVVASARMASTDAPAERDDDAVVGDVDAHTLVDLVWADFWDRFPTLKFSLTEGDIGWIPYFLQRAEHVHERHSGWTEPRLPATAAARRDIFKRPHPRAASSARTIGIELLDRLQHRQRVLGVRLPALRQRLAERARGWSRAVRGPLTDDAGRQDHARERHAPLPVRSVRAPGRRSSARSRRCGPSRPTSTPSRSVGRLATERDAEIFKYALRGIKVPAGGRQ